MDTRESKRQSANVSFTSCVGEGGFGKVYRMTNHCEGQDYAVKIIQVPKRWVNAIRRPPFILVLTRRTLSCLLCRNRGALFNYTDICSEVEALSRVNHRNVVGCKAVCFKEDSQATLEFAPAEGGLNPFKLEGTSGEACPTKCMTVWG